MNDDQISMPFVHKDLIYQPKVEMQRAVRSQNNLYNIFNSKKNAGRISHYFIIHRSTQTINAINFIKLAFLLAVITVYLVLLRFIFINDVKKIKNQIYTSIFEQVDISVQNVLQIPTLFSLYLSVFIKRGNLPRPSNTSAYLYASILTNAHLSSTSHINWWKIGIPNGGLIAIVANSTLSNKWCYVSYDEEDYGSFYEWNTNSNGRNKSYPFMNGVRTGYYNTTSHYWYKMAISSNTTQWTNLYYEFVPDQSTIKSEATFSAVSSVEDQGELICAISVDLSIRYIREFLEAIQVPSNSTLAITTSDGFLIAATSSTGMPLSIGYNGVISPTLQDIDDPVWVCISHDIEFRTVKNFTISCSTEDGTHTYQVFQTILPFSDRYNWTLYAAIKFDDVNEIGKVMYNSQYITPSIICISVIIVFFCLSHLVLSFIFSEQTKLLLSQKQHVKRHVIDSGVYQGLSQLQRATNIRSSGLFYPTDLGDKIKKKLVESPQKLYFDYNNFFNGMNDSQLFDKIKTIYQIDEELLQKTNYFNNLRMHEIHQQNNSNSTEIFGSQKSATNIDNDDSNPTNSSDTTNNDKSAKTTSSNSSNNNNNNSSSSHKESDTVVDVWNQESRSKYMHSQFSIDEPLADLPILDINYVSHHQHIRNLNQTASINTIKNIGVGYNVQHQKLFNIGKFKEFLQFFITTEIPPENLFLLVDSFDLYNMFILFFGSSMFTDHDMIMAGYITLLAFHAATKDRLNQSNRFIDRFFIRNKNDIFKKADSILIQIAKLRTTEIVGDFKRWSNVVSYVHMLCDVTPICRHIEVFQKCRFFIKPSMIFRKLLFDRSIDLLKLFYITASVSFLVNTQSFLESALSRIVTDRKYNRKFNDQFLQCFNTVYLDKLMKSLICICGKTFVKKLTIPL